MEQEFELIAKTFMGLEPVLAEELTQLGANNVQIGRRMVSFTGDKEMMYRANFQLHTAIRILKPIKHFKARSAEEVYDQIQKIKCKINLRKLAEFQISVFHIFKELVIIAVIGITHGRINGLWKDPPLTKSGAEWLNTCICQFLTNGAKLV